MRNFCFEGETQKRELHRARNMREIFAFVEHRKASKQVKKVFWVFETQKIILQIIFSKRFQFTRSGDVWTKILYSISISRLLNENYNLMINFGLNNSLQHSASDHLRRSMIVVLSNLYCSLLPTSLVPLIRNYWLIFWFSNMRGFFWYLNFNKLLLI